MSIPTSPTHLATSRLAGEISRTLEAQQFAKRIIQRSEDYLATLGRQMLEAGATHLEVVTALRGGVHPEEDDEHSLWWQLEAWGVVSK